MRKYALKHPIDSSKMDKIIAYILCLLRLYTYYTKDAINFANGININDKKLNSSKYVKIIASAVCLNTFL